jgi:high-affinity K+ transport system ATPase subunit B
MLKRAESHFLDPRLVRPAALAALRGLDPRIVARRPVLLVIELFALAATLILAYAAASGVPRQAAFIG